MFLAGNVGRIGVVHEPRRVTQKVQNGTAFRNGEIGGTPRHDRVKAFVHPRRLACTIRSKGDEQLTSVGGVWQPADEIVALEPVDQFGDRGSRDLQSFGEFAGGAGAGLRDERTGLDLVDPDSQGLARHPETLTLGRRHQVTQRQDELAILHNHEGTE